MKSEDFFKKSETGCCPRFNPKKWDKKKIVFKDKLFVKDRVFSFLHMPLNFGRVMTRNSKLIDEVEGYPKDFLMLNDENSLWGSDLYLAVDKKIPNAKNVKLSGTFLTKVFEGPYKNMGTWIKQMESYVKSKNKKASKFLFYYTTCPKCAKYYGKNYVVIFAKIK